MLENNDYTLQENSPCIDAGTAYFEYEGEVIVDIPESSYYGIAPDMGAFEWYPEDPEFEQGDINYDGMINVLDVVIMMDFILEIELPDESQFNLSDLNGDGSIDVLDIVALVNIILG